jgi:hypothetical protein
MPMDARCPVCKTALPVGAEKCPHCKAVFPALSATPSGRDLLNPGEAGSRVRPSGGPQQVSVIDVDMPFGSMVSFMVKWAIASIPALIIIFILLFIFFAIASMLFGGLFAAFAR